MHSVNKTLLKGLLIAMLATGLHGADQQPATADGQYATVEEQSVPFKQHFEAMAELRARAQLSDEELLQKEGVGAGEDVEQLIVTRSLKKALAQDPTQYKSVSAAVHLVHGAAYHTILERSLFGDSLSLWDGSGWVVNPNDQWIALHWGTGDPVVITPHHGWLFDDAYKFKLVHRETGESVRVNMVRGPHIASAYYRYIIMIDYYNQNVMLNDGTLWHLSDIDTEDLDDWLVNQVIVIGINDGYFSFKPNILINVSRYTYLPARLL